MSSAFVRWLRHHEVRPTNEQRVRNYRPIVRSRGELLNVDRSLDSGAR